MTHTHNFPSAIRTPIGADEPLLLDNFSVVMPDDSMAPILVEGDRVFLDRSLTPRVGDVVLVADQLGEWWLRNYESAPDGSWQATAHASGYGPALMPSAGAVVVAVCDGTQGRRAR